MEGKKDLSQVSSATPSQLIWSRFKSNPLSIIGLIIISTFLLIAILGPFIRPDSSTKANFQNIELSRKHPGFQVEMLRVKDQKTENSFFENWIFGFETDFYEIPVYFKFERNDSVIVEKYTGESPNNGEVLTFALSEKKLNGQDNLEFYTKTYLLGTDRYGRDMLSRLMAGTWISFTVGFISIIISLLIGISLGLIAGYYKGKTDDIIMWFINLVWSIPTLLLVIAITFALGKGFWQVFVAVGLTMWVEVARVVRGQVLSVREKEFIEAGRSFGFSDFRILFRHLLPNITGPIIVISASNFAAAILIEAGMSFLGLGAQPPQATWGKMISEHKGYIVTGDAYLAILPGIAIFILVLSFVLVGNGLRDSFDTKVDLE